MDNIDIKLILLGLIVIGSIIKVYKNSAKVKGRESEQQLANKINLKSYLGYGGEVYTNVYVPKSNAEYSEIDVVYLTQKGIFVFENKNYEGYIFGNGNSKEWTVTLYGGKNIFGGNKVEKYKFYNPIWQNNTHVKSLRQYLKTNVPIYSFITFSDRGELKNITYDSNAIVCYHSELNREFSKLWQNITEVIDGYEYERLAEEISQLTNVSNKVKQEHINNINKKDTKPHQASIMNYTETCPSCGGKLLIRTAKKGKNIGNKFYGCSNYPNCTYTRNI